MIRFLVYVKECILLKLSLFIFNLSELSNVEKDKNFTMSEYGNLWTKEYLKNFKECLRKEVENGESKN